MQLLSQLWFVVFLSEHIASHVNLKMLLSSYKRLSYKNIESMRMDKFMSWMSCQLVLCRLLQPTCVPNHSDFLLGFIEYTCLSACCFFSGLVEWQPEIQHLQYHADIPWSGVFRSAVTGSFTFSLGIFSWRKLEICHPLFRQMSSKLQVKSCISQHSPLVYD